MDMPGLDISPPTKKSGKSKEKSKVVSSGGENQSKRNSFGFSFDFDGFGLDFESKKKKVEENSNKPKDKEGHSNASASGGSGDFLTKDVDASDSDDISLQHPASRGVAISTVDTRMDNIEDPDPINEDDHLKSEPIKESHSSEKRCSPEPLAQKVVQDSSGHSEAHNVSTEGMFSDVQEEESRTIVRMVSPSTGDEQNGNVRPVAESVLTRNLSAHMNSQSQTGEMCEARDDDVLIGYIDVDDTSKADSHPESSLTSGIQNLAREEMVDKGNADLFSRLHVDSLEGGIKIDKLASGKERENIPIRSKYFTRQNENESEVQQASVSSTKLISIGNKRMSTIPNTSALEKRSDVHPSSSVEQSKKSLSQKSLTTGLQLTSMASTLNTRKFVYDKNRISPTKAETRNKEKDQKLQGNMVKRSPSVDTKKQTPSTPSLKREASEEYAEIPRLTPLKRLSSSPRSNIRASSERVIDEQICNQASVIDGKSPRLDVSQIDMDMSSAIENDSIFEKAEACSKELEDICNMLKNKHEETKDVLVRAIVNNNNLLMLNHPVYQDNIFFLI